MGAILRQNFWGIIPLYHGREGGVNPLSDHKNVIMREPFMRYYKASTKGTKQMTFTQSQMSALIYTAARPFCSKEYATILEQMDVREFLDYLLMARVINSAEVFARSATR